MVKYVALTQGGAYKHIPGLRWVHGPKKKKKGSVKKRLVKKFLSKVKASLKFWLCLPIM